MTHPVADKKDGTPPPPPPTSLLATRALTAAEIPARLEPSCLSRNDGKRPDGLTLVSGDIRGSWRRGSDIFSETLVAALLSQLASRNPLSFCSNV